jgi:hypothetical protein
MKFQMAIRTLAMPLKMAMMKEAMAEMTELIACDTSARESQVKVQAG